MTRLWGKTWALEVIGTNGATRTYEGMRLAFSAPRKAGSRTVDASVTVWMPDPALVTSIEEGNVTVRVLAGWRDGGAIEVAQGERVRRTVSFTREGADEVLAFRISGGGTAMLGTVISHSWSSVKTSDAVEYIRQQLGLAADVIQFGTDVEYSRGYVIAGPAANALSDLCASSGSRWSVEAGRLRVVPLTGYSRVVSDRWTSETGLLQVSGPAGDGLVRASALLRPGLLPKDQIEIVDERYAGRVNITELVNDGDTHGDTWQTSIVGEPA